MDWKNVKGNIIKKLILLAFIVIGVLVLSLTNEMVAIPTTEISAQAGMDVMAGNSTTVKAMAVQNSMAKFITVVRLLVIIITIILAVGFIIDTYVDVQRFRKEKLQEDQVEKT